MRKLSGSHYIHGQSGTDKYTLPRVLPLWAKPTSVHMIGMSHKILCLGFRNTRPQKVFAWRGSISGECVLLKIHLEIMTQSGPLQQVQDCEEEFSSFVCVVPTGVQQTFACSYSIRKQAGSTNPRMS